jgi:hypothetical protein
MARTQYTGVVIDCAHPSVFDLDDRTLCLVLAKLQR